MFTHIYKVIIAYYIIFNIALKPVKTNLLHQMQSADTPTNMSTETAAEMLTIRIKVRLSPVVVVVMGVSVIMRSKKNVLIIVIVNFLN